MANMGTLTGIGWAFWSISKPSLFCIASLKILQYWQVYPVGLAANRENWRFYQSWQWRWQSIFCFKIYGWWTLLLGPNVKDGNWRYYQGWQGRWQSIFCFKLNDRRTLLQGPNFNYVNSRHYQAWHWRWPSIPLASNFKEDGPFS